MEARALPIGGTLVPAFAAACAADNETRIIHVNRQTPTASGRVKIGNAALTVSKGSPETDYAGNLAEAGLQEALYCFNQTNSGVAATTAVSAPPSTQPARSCCMATTSGVCVGCSYLPR